MHRAIVHLDADAFFASVEQAADSRLRGKPVAVGGEKRGIIASASYEARKFGVFTPMPTIRARKLCPKLIVLPGDFDKYEQFSRTMFSYAYDFTPDVEQTSIDEGYFDLTRTRKAPGDIALTIRKAIGQSLKISVSEGIGSSKLVSQIASKLNKPATFMEIPPGQEIRFLHPLPNFWLPGIGPKTASRLNSAGLAQIKHLCATPLELLQLLLGKAAWSIRQFSKGIDERPVVPIGDPAKSFSQQETFAVDITDEEYAQAILRRMADYLFATVRAEGRGIRTVTVKVRYNDMADDQCSEDIYGRLHTMLRQAWKRRVSLRLVSLKLSNVYGGAFREELPLEREAQQHAARQRLAKVVDELRRTRGYQVLLRGHDFRLREDPVQGVAVRPIIRSRSVTYRRTGSQFSPIRAARYVPLNVHSVYSFLNSTLSIESIIDLAKQHHLPAVALTDQGNLHGAAHFAQTAREAGIKPIIGTELEVGDHRLLLYVESTSGYHNLCRLLSRKIKRIQTKAQGAVDNETVAVQLRRPLQRRDLEGTTDGLIAMSSDARLAELFPGRFYFGVQRPDQLKQAPAGLPRVLYRPVHYASPGDRLKFDIVQSIRTLTLLRQAHRDKKEGGDFRFQSPAEIQHGFGDAPDVPANTIEIAERCTFDFPFGKQQFPAFRPPDGSSSRDFLHRLVTQGLRERYRDRAGEMSRQIEEELSIISEVGYEEYFLVVWDILQECRRRGIEWITRGSAADSLVCYCLRISDVCPIRFDLYFRRFLNKERMALNKLPDIDIDFAHDLKDDVVNLIFDKYGRDHCAVVGGFSTFQARSAFAEVAKVLGVSEREVRKFTEHFPWGFGGGWVPDEPAPKGGAGLIELLRAGPETRDLPLEEEPYKTALEMAEFLAQSPRHPKMHPCGVVLSRQPLHELTPTFMSNKGYPTTHFDMDWVEAIGLVKIDILAQGGLAAMRDVKTALAARGIEIDGLIAIVSVIRPGAANEGKKQSFTRRYQGLEPVAYPDPSLEPCLKSTFGLVVYEEHILQICELFAGLPPGRADVLRRALNKYKRSVIKEIKGEFFESASKRCHAQEKIAEVWDLVAGFAGYAFCRAHSTAYGVEAFQSAWLKRYYPAEFMAAVLTNGKGFYHPLVYVLECHRLGVPLSPPSVNQAGPAFTVAGAMIRVPLLRIKGLTQRTRERIIEERERGEFHSMADFYRRVVPTPEEIEAMIRVGAFDEFGKTRTAQFWDAQFLQRSFRDAAQPAQGWLLPPPGADRLPEVALREPTRRERLQWETELFGFAVTGHPLELHEDVAWDTYCPVAKLGEYIGEQVVTCGLVIEQRIHHQVTGEPMKFLTLCDWTGMVETELFAATYRSYGLATVRYPVLEILAAVEPFENGRGFSLRVHRASRPRIADQQKTVYPNRTFRTNAKSAIKPKEHLAGVH
ncbi:MAG: PHP domain-containing protein [Verrucomicrobia bacterium]|nr:MAG: PHP domain-containing protein [Verrucomicrobiota bacterium]